MSDNTSLLTMQEAMDLSCMSQKRISHLCRDKKIYSFKEKGALQIDRTSLEEYMLSQNIPLNIAGQKVYTSSQVAKQLHIGLVTVNELCDSGELGSFMAGSHRRIPESFLEAFKQEHNIPDDIAKQKVYKTSEVARKLGCSDSQAKILYGGEPGQGELNFYWIGVERRVPESYLQEYLNRNKPTSTLQDQVMIEKAKRPEDVSLTISNYF